MIPEPALLPPDQNPRLGIIQRVLTPYRAPFFEKLAVASEFEVALFAGQPTAHEALATGEAPASICYFHADNDYHYVLGNMLVWQHNVEQWLEQFNPDVLVIEANPRILSHHAAIQWMHYRRRPVLGWGLGELERKGVAILQYVRSIAARRLIRNLDGVIAYSSKARADYIAAGMASDKIYVAHNSIDNSESERYLLELSDLRWVPSWRREMGLDQKLPIVLFVGRLIAQKRVDMLIDACSSIFESCQLLIVGAGSAREQLEERALPYAGRIRFGGHLTGAALARCFMASALFVLPAAGGLALQQAMSYGKPVIASFGDGTEADLIREGYNGFIFHMGDIEDLALRIQAVLSDPERLYRMGQNSLAIVRKEINLDTMSASFLGAVRTTRANASA